MQPDAARKSFSTTLRMSHGTVYSWVHDVTSGRPPTQLSALPQYRWTWRRLAPPMPAGLAAGAVAMAAGAAAAGATGGAAAAVVVTVGPCPLLAVARCPSLHILLATAELQWCVELFTAACGSCHGIMCPVTD